MTNEDVDVLESLAWRLQKKYGTEAAGKLMSNLLMGQMEAAIRPDGSDSFIMGMMSSPNTHPTIKEFLQKGGNTGELDSVGTDRGNQEGT